MLRKILIVKIGLKGDLESTSFEKEKTEKIISHFSQEQIIEAIEKLNNAAGQVKTSVLGQVPLEVAVFELTKSQFKISNNQFPISKQIQNPKSKIQNSDLDIKNEKKIKSVIPNSGERIASGGKTFSPNLWPEIFKEVKSHNNTLAAMLRDASFIGNSNKEIKLAVRFKFHAEQICNKKNLNVIEKALGKVCGSNYKVNCIVNPNLVLKKPQDSEEELLNSTLEVFESDE